jgi:hypothetical protein
MWSSDGGDFCHGYFVFVGEGMWVRQGFESGASLSAY